MFERIIEFSPAYDRRHPEPSKNYGIHSVELRFVLKGSAGAVQFLLYTGWFLPHNTRELEASGHPPAPLPADLGYHSPKPMYEDQEPIADSCVYLDDQPCYYDGSGLNAIPAFHALLVGGDEGIWSYLEAYYKHTFENGPFPDPPIPGEERK